MTVEHKLQMLLYITLTNNQPDAQTFKIHLLQSSTRFEQYLDHPRPHRDLIPRQSTP
jgi:uncharacterized protein (DUF924 family)